MEQEDLTLYAAMESTLARARILLKLSEQYSDHDEFMIDHGQHLSELVYEMDALLPLWSSMAKTRGVLPEVCSAISKNLHKTMSLLECRERTRH